MLYEGALVPILASLVYCAIVVGVPLPPHKGPTVDIDTVGVIGHYVRDSETGYRDSVYCLKASYAFNSFCF